MNILMGEIFLRYCKMLPGLAAKFLLAGYSYLGDSYRRVYCILNP